MKDSPFRLQDKTILLTGPFNGVTQALLRTLTELGADIAFVNEKTPMAAKYADGVNEAREARPDYGRAAYFDLPLNSESQIKEALGRVAEGIGRMDVLIDASPLAWTTTTDVPAALERSAMMSQALTPFFNARQRGRIIYLFEDSALASTGVEGFVGTYQEHLNEYISLTAISYLEKSVTVNGVALGVTEDFILRHFPKSGSIKKSLVELQTKRPGVKIVEPLEIITGLAYLACPSSGSLTGQVLRLTHGM
jgi:NAD(P)-dependent dehydrogenase (short-subunit alcohol dehydrogenase family)